MEDEIVSFETAVLAYNKGFRDKISCIGGKNYYNYKGELNGDSSEQLKDYLAAKKEDRDPDDFYLSISAPTQSCLQRWIREKHNIHISINIGLPHKNCIMYYCNVIKFGIHHKSKFKSQFYNTYEEALEEGLYQALKLIKI